MSPSVSTVLFDLSPPLNLVCRHLILAYLRLTEPDAILDRKSRRFKRKRFYSTGVNEFWTFDQHDKWRVFGLMLHVGVEGYSGRILWLRVWWSNRNPRLIASYYFAVVRELQG